ncbi:hypothetical protein A2U01_0072263, partial [Trifolium medium]|nr:hypothetical protein [Trifolium medium]
SDKRIKEVVNKILARNNELKEHTVITLVVAAVLCLVIKGNKGQVHKGVVLADNLIALCKVVDRIIGHQQGPLFLRNILVVRLEIFSKMVRSVFTVVK